MKQLITSFLLIGALFIAQQARAQIGINNDNSEPDPSAMLDVKSTTSGFLTPRMTKAERDAIPNPATSLLIYQTDDTPGFYYNSGTVSTPNWVRIGNDDQEVICDARIPIDSVAHFATYNGAYTSYLITEPGSYFLTDSIFSNQLNAAAIIIDSDNVTLDLNGFLIGGRETDPLTFADGIRVDGTHYNITIKNGVIDNWGDNAIDARGLNNSLFQNINTSNCGSWGFYIGSNNVVTNSIAYNNGSDGFSAVENCNFIRCTSSENAGDGYDVFSGSQFVNCTAFDNELNGFNGRDDALVLGCIAIGNVQVGIEINDNGFVHKCNVYDNMGTGIDVGSSSRVSYCIAALNDGDGIRLRGTEGVVQDCVAHENELIGIHASNTTTCNVLIKDNGVTDNDANGIQVSGPGAFVIRNRATGNTNNPTPLPNNYNLHPDTNHGPILQVINYGDLINLTNGNHPYANFLY